MNKLKYKWYCLACHETNPNGKASFSRPYLLQTDKNESSVRSCSKCHSIDIKYLRNGRED